MVNLILNFVENKKKKGQLMAFKDKKVHFICHDSKEDVKPGEFWECFLWSARDKFNLVKPFKKINPDDLESEEKRVAEFNKELKILEKKVGDEFTKIVFDKNNKPFLLTTVSEKILREKYPMFIFIKDGDKLLARPIITPDDRVLWREQQNS